MQLRPRLLLPLFCALLCSCAGPGSVTGSGTHRAAVAVARPPVLGADVSALTVMEKARAHYADAAGRGAEVISILRKAGADCFRLRLFVAPNNEGMVTNDLEYTLALARRVKASGAAFMLDIHYSDTWADPSKQFKPAAWEQLGLDALEAKVREYTRETLARFVAEGLRPEYVQVGNEITNGMLWPTGKAEYGMPGDQEGWDRLARFLKAGVEGVEAGAAGGPLPKVILHIESTGNVPRSLWFFRNALSRGVRFDIIGLSYYPEWHGTIADLQATLNTLAAEFGKPVMVAEVAYPWKHDTHFDGKPHLQFPATPEGQRMQLLAVRAAVAAVPGGLGLGVMYWHPEGTQAQGVSAWLAGSCALFNDEGLLLPGADLFAPAK